MASLGRVLPITCGKKGQLGYFTHRRHLNPDSPSSLFAVSGALFGEAGQTQGALGEDEFASEPNTSLTNRTPTGRQSGLESSCQGAINKYSSGAPHFPVPAAPRWPGETGGDAEKKALPNAPSFLSHPQEGRGRWMGREDPEAGLWQGPRSPPVCDSVPVLISQRPRPWPPQVSGCGGGTRRGTEGSRGRA